jgi:tetrahydromethanopterin S-methyltransferase subunit G
MSKVESQNSDAKKLALRCKTLEVQLRQSIPKKEHNEIVSKLERENSYLEKDLDRTKAELQKTTALNRQLSAIGDQITVQNKSMTGQGRVIDSLLTKISQGTIPASIHLQSLSKIRELEEQIRGMVSKVEYTSLERRCEELSGRLNTMIPASEYSSLRQRFEEVSRQINNTVPASEYSSVKQKLDELENTFSSMVPKEQLSSTEARVRELEARLAEHVPQNVYDELVSKIVSLAEDVTGGALSAEGAEAAAQVEANEGAPTAPAEQNTAESAETSQQGTPPEVLELVATSSGTVESVSTASENSVPEIREIQSQLAEITSQANEVAQVNTDPSSGDATPAGPSKAEVVVATVPEAAKTTIEQTAG